MIVNVSMFSYCVFCLSQYNVWFLLNIFLQLSLSLSSNYNWLLQKVGYTFVESIKLGHIEFRDNFTHFLLLQSSSSPMYWIFSALFFRVLSLDGSLPQLTTRMESSPATRFVTKSEVDQVPPKLKPQMETEDSFLLQTSRKTQHILLR